MLWLITDWDRGKLGVNAPRIDMIVQIGWLRHGLEQLFIVFVVIETGRRANDIYALSPKLNREIEEF